MCVCLISPPVCLCESLFSRLYAPLPFLHGVGICGSVRLACVSVFVYLSSKLCLLSPCGSLSHLRSGSLFLDPLPVGEHPPLPELSPVRARGRVRGSGMLSAD